jgi:hypothetical protein
VTDSQGASSAPTSVDVTVNGAWEAPTFFVNGEVDEKGQKAATEHVINGSGIPATDYQIVRADDAGIELGLQVHYRNGPVVLPTDGNGYADGVIEFQVADGPQTPATSPGFPAALNRAAWSFDYSVITGLNGESTDLADFTFVFKVDVDPTAATNFQVFTMSPVGTGSAGVHWTNQFGDVVVDDNGILGEVAQNSRNLAFYDVDHVTPGTQPYDAAFGPGQLTSSYKPLMALTRSSPRTTSRSTWSCNAPRLVDNEPRWANQRGFSFGARHRAPALSPAACREPSGPATLRR